MDALLIASSLCEPVGSQPLANKREHLRSQGAACVARARIIITREPPRGDKPLPLSWAWPILGQIRPAGFVKQRVLANAPVESAPLFVVPHSPMRAD